jgi:cell fate regulator YaaT (PSP1 superfamily)
MAIVVGVRFRTAGKIYDFSPGDENFEKGEYVIVETARGIECGEVQNGNHEVPEHAVVAPLKGIERRATSEDVARNDDNKRREKEAQTICQERIRKHKLEMKLIDVEYTFDNSKILFYFTADGRVDFRDLVKDLASVFRTRIELRQIGVRDEAKMMGAIGTCGRELCCSTFLSEFHPVSIKMAKEQSLSLNPTKISGTCGRLMCCLKYETEAYEYLIKRSPKVDAIVKTPQGQGTVVMVCLLKESVKVRLDTENANDLIEVKVEDLEVIRDGSGGKRHGSSDGRGGPPREAADSTGRNTAARETEKPSGRDGNRNANREKNRDNRRDGAHAEKRAGRDAAGQAEAVQELRTVQYERIVEENPSPDWNDAVIEVPLELIALEE